MKLVLERVYIDDACAAYGPYSSQLEYPHPRLDSADEANPVATCCFVGQVVDSCYFDYGYASYSCPYECTADDILTDAKKDFINARLDWVEGYFKELFQSRPLVEPIDLDVEKESTRRIGGVDGLNVTIDSDVHLYIVVTANPSGLQPGVAGYAFPLQHQYATLASVENLGGTDMEGNGRGAQRLIVGQFNWCPDTINEDDIDSNFQKGSSNRLVVHELLHLLNAVKTSSSYHANAWGGQMCPDQIYYDSTEEWSGVRTRKVITPTALALAQEQFGCDTLPGIPLENQVIGYGSHWETRCFGPEVLAYGENMGESYISDVTLGFIEDMGFYVANYSAAGRFGNADTIDTEIQNSSFLLSDTTGADDIASHTTNASDFSPGFLRWGRLQGCDFCFGSPKNWPEEYLCTSDSTAGCTPDNKMSARCSLNEWGGSTDNPQAPSPLLYEPDSSNSWTAKDASDYDWGGYTGNIPEMYNYLDDTTPSDGITGGYSDAADFAPVFVGYWNCLDEQPPSDLSNLFAAPEGVSVVDVTDLNATELQISAEEDEENADKIGFDDLFSAAGDELGQIGGQSYGSTARCFESSLVPLVQIYSIDLTFTKNGLCYVANCYSKEYLQVGVRATTGDLLLYWYGCPTEGGILYIPGFTGSIQCPVATDFCFNEDVSGLLYSEIDLTLEWILWGCAAGVITIGFIVIFACWKKIDHKVHFCCGINQDQKNWAQIMEKRHGKHSCAAYVLTAFGVLWLLPGLTILGFAIYTLIPDTELLWDTQSRQVPIMFVLSLVMIIISSMGIDGSWKPRPSITLVCYFYIVLLLSLFTLLVIVMPFVLVNVLEQVASAHWESTKNSFPDSWQNYNSSTALAEVKNLLISNVGLVVAGIVFVVVSEVQGVICAFLNLTTHVVVRNFEMIMNLIFLGLGITALCVSVPTHRLLSQQIFLTSLICSIILLCTGSFGVFAACQRKDACFRFYGWFGVLNCVALCTGGFLLLAYGGAFSQTSYETNATFCSETYNPSNGQPYYCVCPVGDISCPIVSCVDTQVQGNCNAELAEVRASYNDTTIENGQCFAPATDLSTHYFYCDYTTNFVSDFEMNGCVSEFILSLNQTALGEIATQYTTTESMDMETLLAWVETDVTLVGCLLLVVCVVQIVLIGTNRCIIQWNVANEWPHGKDPFYKMLHVAAHRTDMRSKMMALRAFNAAGRGKLGYKGIKVAPASIDKSKRFEVSLKLEQEAFGDGVWGLGMSFAESVVGARRKVVVQGFRVGEDDDGNPVRSPGLVAGLKIGDVIVMVDHIDLVAGLKEFSKEVNEDQFKEEVELTIERILVKGKRAKTKPKAKFGVYPEVTRITLQRKPGQSLGINISEIFGSGNEGYGLDKAYLMVNKVVPGSPAELAGLRVNDTILACDGEMVFSIDALLGNARGKNRLELITNRMMECQPGGSFRQSNVIDLDIELDSNGMGGVGLGARIIEVTSGLGADSSMTFLMLNSLIDYKDGRVGPAQSAGMKQYDLLLMVNGKEANTLKEFVSFIGQTTTPKLTVRRIAFEFGSQSLFSSKEAKGLVEVELSVTRDPSHGLGVSLNEAYRNGEHDPFIVVTAVRPETAAHSAGVHDQDLIMDIDGSGIYSIDDVRCAIEGKSEFKMTVQRFAGHATNSSGINSSNFWDIADNLFDKIDSAAGGTSDGNLSVADMQSYFRNRSGVAKRYIDEIDGYSNSTNGSPDGMISRDEWYGYFDFLAEADTGVAETSPEAYGALRDLSTDQ
jgi:hypothetical protein